MLYKAFVQFASGHCIPYVRIWKSVKATSSAAHQPLHNNSLQFLSNFYPESPGTCRLRFTYMCSRNHYTALLKSPEERGLTPAQGVGPTQSNKGSEETLVPSCASSSSVGSMWGPFQVTGIYHLYTSCCDAHPRCLVAPYGVHFSSDATSSPRAGSR